MADCFVEFVDTGNYHPIKSMLYGVDADERIRSVRIMVRNGRSVTIHRSHAEITKANLGKTVVLAPKVPDLEKTIVGIILKKKKENQKKQEKKDSKENKSN